MFTASSWLNELADAGLVVRQKIGRGLVFINASLLDRIFTISDAGQLTSNQAPARYGEFTPK